MRIDLDKSFRKKFIKLPSTIKEKYVERVELFIKDKFNPQLRNHSVDRAYPGCRSINITGDYRIIFEDEGETVTFITIGTHSELY